MPSDAKVDEIIQEVRKLGPFRKHPAGELYAYAHPERAEPGEPVGVYVPAEDVIRRYITQVHTNDWTPTRRNAVLEFLKDESYTTLTGDISLPLIPTLSGILDLSDPTAEEPTILPHSPHYGFTSQVPHAFNPRAECPAVDQFLANALPQDAISVFWELLGYTLLPVQFLRKAVMLVGPSGTGKSTLLSLVEAVVGSENCSNVSLQSFGEDRFATSNLFGKLANLGGDLDAREVVNTGTFKSLTGDDPIRADVKYGKPITFRSYATNWFAANDIPPSRDHSDAWRGRWVTLPMKNQPGRPDLTLRHRITRPNELEGALRRSVEALTGLLLRGHIKSSSSVNEAAQEFYRRTDHIQGFIQYARQKPGSKTVDQVFTWYKAWAEEEGVKPVRKSLLLQRLSEVFTKNERGFVIK